MDFKQHIVDRKNTPQDTKVPGVKKQTKNNAGGISFKLNKWDYFERFLIIGTENGCFYVGQKELTDMALDNVKKCINKNGIKAVNLIVRVSSSGKAADNDFAIFALALASSCADSKTRAYALSKLTSVCRIGTHLFTFVSFVNGMRGWGRSLREGIAHWYTSKATSDLAYQLLKYKERNGWSHKDVIRLSHPIPANDDMNELFAHVVGAGKSIPKVSNYAIGAEFIKNVTDPGEAASLIKKYNLTREVVPTEFLKERVIWEALLEEMPMGALVRNLGKMASLGMHDILSETEKDTCQFLTNEKVIKKSRIHPIKVMDAYLAYGEGKSSHNRLSWEPSTKVMLALQDCFSLSFDNVEPTGKKILLALDVSGSMDSKLNKSQMSCRVASAVLAMQTLKVEENSDILGFTEGGQDAITFGNGTQYGHHKNYISRLPISSTDTIVDVVKKTSDLPFSGTDCSLPFMYCEEKEIDVDAIVIYTDNETWSGTVHPWQALDRLQSKLGHEVKCVVVGMTATRFSIARPDYANMLDIAGFSPDVPALISDFINK